jgi:TrmH family RNA methyltransferase
MAVPSAVISSRTNPRVKQLRAAFSGNPKISDGLIAIEGEHLLEEALRSGIALRTVFLTSDRQAPSQLSRDTEIIRLSEDVFSSVAETRSSQGIAALIEPVMYSIRDMFQIPTPLILICAGLQDPGNLGTLIRSAEAFGASGVLTSSGTVSPWNQKALRASAGSVFRVPVAVASQEEIGKLGIRLLAAVGSQRSDVLSAQDADLRQPCAIMIGNEGSGLTDEWLQLATARVTIPCPGPVESLNAAIAGSLLLYEASRQRSTASRQTDATTVRIPNLQPRRPTGAAR